MNESGLREKWDERYRAAADDAPPDAARVLLENAHLLPPRGRALDLACGRGGNALWLAGRGLETHAWDLSPVAIETLRRHAADAELQLHVETRDVVAAPPSARSFDLVVVSHFLERALFPALLAALRPDGLLCYQTFTRSRVSERGPSNPTYRLADNELLQLCRGLRILVYREEARAGDITRGFRDEAMLVGQRP